MEADRPTPAQGVNDPGTEVQNMVEAARVDICDAVDNAKEQLEGAVENAKDQLEAAAASMMQSWAEWQAQSSKALKSGVKKAVAKTMDPWIRWMEERRSDIDGEIRTKSREIVRDEANLHLDWLRKRCDVVSKKARNELLRHLRDFEEKTQRAVLSAVADTERGVSDVVHNHLQGVGITLDQRVARTIADKTPDIVISFVTSSAELRRRLAKHLDRVRGAVRRASEVISRVVAWC